MYAIVIPFTNKEIPDLIFDLELWNRNNHLIAYDEYNNIDLVFYYHKHHDDKIEEKILHVAEKYTKYFNSISFTYANLNPSDDKYPLGSGLMFFNYILNNPQYEYIFYKETDCFPVKDNWLKELLNKISKCHGDKLWVMGSMFSGNKNPFNEAYKMLHMNGNAIYATGNNDYRLFMENIFKNIDVSINYDIEIFRYLFKLENYRYLRDYMINSKYSDFVLNFGKKEIDNILEDTPHQAYFLHGKKIKEALHEKYNC